MSTFRGFVKEIPGITVDRFDGDNWNASVYFLTHSHTDHTVGLCGNFFRHLESTGRRLYCTQLTKLFLLRKYEVEDKFAPCIIELKPCAPRIVDYQWKGQKEVITVNCIPAGHSPGSVMFIFEQDSKRVLCTGDFRILPVDLPKIKPLNSTDGSGTIPLKFDNIYLDTTFLNPEYAEFPTRNQSLDTICKRVREWLGRSTKNIVSLECSALTGSEFIFMELMEKIGKPIHVKDNIYEDYLRIEELARCVTLNPTVTPLHACVSKRFSRDQLPCRTEVDGENILTIVVSAYRWRNRKLSTFSEWDKTKKNRLYVCCSMHPSYNELQAFLEYFQPLNVHPCVDPPADSQLCASDVLREMRQKYCPKPETKIDYDLKSLIGNSSGKKRSRSQYISDDSSD
ncbi:protein artemis [Venturia canescens]|uniref:protein artemis n=1 Tax=Venturia canescens TaxID=32260 RepID=UPI001C9CBE38|nr:protein artemis [Venturia canescens]